MRTCFVSSVYSCHQPSQHEKQVKREMIGKLEFPLMITIKNVDGWLHCCCWPAAAVILFDMCVCVSAILLSRVRSLRSSERLLLKFSFSCDYCQCRRSSWRSSASLNMSKRGFLIFCFSSFVFLVILLVLFPPRLLINKSAGYLKRLSRHISPLFTDYWTCLMTERMQRAAP